LLQYKQHQLLFVGQLQLLRNTVATCVTEELQTSLLMWALEKNKNEPIRFATGTAVRLQHYTHLHTDL
jgi:hypothetical protein